MTATPEFYVGLTLDSMKAAVEDERDDFRRTAILGAQVFATLALVAARVRANELTEELLT